MKQKVITLVLSIIFIASLLHTAASAQETSPTEKAGVILRVYGPGDPAPAMREVAKIFGDKNGIRVEINAGPTPTWKDQAAKDAKLIFSGSEYMRPTSRRKTSPG